MALRIRSYLNIEVLRMLWQGICEIAVVRGMQLVHLSRNKTAVRTALCTWRKLRTVQTVP